jgi:hypothetical protein
MDMPSLEEGLKVVPACSFLYGCRLHVTVWRGKHDMFVLFCLAVQVLLSSESLQMIFVVAIDT